MENLDAAMIHDNLSHHLTHYKAALQAGDRATADKHLAQVMKTMQYGRKLETATQRGSDVGAVRLRSGSTKPHSLDQATGERKALSHEGSELILPHAWEMNYSGSERKPSGEIKEDTKGFGRQLTSGVFPDYRYMEMKAHPNWGGKKTDEKNDAKRAKDAGGYADQAYPFHEIQVNGRYVDIGDIKSPGKYVEHPFDQHPALGHAYSFASQTKGNPSQQFIDAHKKWHSSPVVEQWLADQTTKHEDPDYAQRGTKISNPVHDTTIENPHPYDTGRRKTTVQRAETKKK
jgi:hypothetical protein